MKTSWYLTVLRHSSWNTTRASDHSLRVHDLFIWSLRKRMQCRRSTLCTGTSCELLRSMSNPKIHNSEWKRKSERLQLLKELGECCLCWILWKVHFQRRGRASKSRDFRWFLSKTKGGGIWKWKFPSFLKKVSDRKIQKSEIRWNPSKKRQHSP